MLDSKRYSAFIESLKYGDLPTVEQEFQPIFLNQPDSSGYLPLHIASQGSNLEVLKFLLGQNCNIESKDSNGWRPIHFAVLNKNMNNIKLLFGFGCELSMNDEILQDLINRPNYQDVKNIITTAIKNYQVGKEMDLKCNLECDHKFCLTSICFNEFSEGQFIDRGRYGKISKIFQSGGSRIFAIKKINWKTNLNDVIENLKKEALMVETNINKYRSELVHERITKYYGAIIKGYKMYIFMDFYHGGSIYELLNTLPEGLPDERLLKYTKQILEGLSFLHENRIIHGDLKSQNILLDTEDNCKLTDLGCSRFIESLNKYSQKHSKAGIQMKHKELPQSKFGTANNMAPEMIQGLSYDLKADIWSAAATIYEMFDGQPLFAGKKENVVLMKLAKGELPDYKKHRIKENTDCKIISLMDSMFIKDPNKRPTAKMLLKTYFDINIL